ncbi:MAG: 50S ribosomal protein L37e [Candidatus Nitrosocaldaceae archaeon]
MKGTTSMGKLTRKHVHVRCRRCGSNSYHLKSKRCSKCGFPDPKWRRYSFIRRKE